MIPNRISNTPTSSLVVGSEFVRENDGEAEEEEEEEAEEEGEVRSWTMDSVVIGGLSLAMPAFRMVKERMRAERRERREVKDMVWERVGEKYLLRMRRGVNTLSGKVYPTALTIITKVAPSY